MFVLKNLRRRKLRTLLTVLGVSIGVAVIVAMFTVARGVRKQFDSMFAAGNAELVVSRKGAADPFISYLPETLVAELLAVEGVAEVYPFLMAVQQLPTMPFFFYFGVSGQNPMLVELPIQEGSTLFDTAVEKPICLGREAMDALGHSLGDTMEIANHSFEVVGIFESTMSMLEAGALLKFADAQLVSGLEGKISSATLHTKDPSPAAVEQLERTLEREFEELAVTKAGEFTQAFDEFEFSDTMVRALSILAMVFGGIGVMNTMLMSVFERTREIGILQAVGWSKGMVLRQIVGEGILLCFLGGPVGALLGTVTLRILSRFDSLAWLKIDVDPLIFFEAFLLAVGMGIVGTLLPAWRAVQVTPVEALRYE